MTSKQAKWKWDEECQKAFDTMKFLPLFSALRQQGVPETYIQCLGSVEYNLGSILIIYKVMCFLNFEECCIYFVLSEL